MLDERKLQRLGEVLRVLEASIAELRDALDEEVNAIPDSPDGWATVNDVALLLDVSITPARNWMVRNGAIQLTPEQKSRWLMPWNKAMRLLQDPTIRKPRRNLKARGQVHNPEGITG
jgi:hypothetical protein